ncbi:hypothetical protein GTR27_003794, partial [Salmonella enterica]|nr:hypothetical protein [Salmonella enterica]
FYFIYFCFVKPPFSRRILPPFPDLLAKRSPDRESYCKIPFPFFYYQIFVVERLPFP